MSSPNLFQQYVMAFSVYMAHEYYTPRGDEAYKVWKVERDELKAKLERTRERLEDAVKHLT